MRTRGRKEETRKVRQTYILFCSWKSEINYFNGVRKSLRDKTNIKIETKLIDLDAQSLVEKVKRIKEKNSWDRNDKYYVIIDRDPWNNSEKQILKAIQIANENWIKVLISNISIEVRFILHFELFNSSWYSVEKYMKKLSNLLWTEYIKNDPLIFDKLRINVENAIRYAKKLETKQKTINPNVELCFCEPYTSVYKLMEKLIKI